MGEKTEYKKSRETVPLSDSDTGESNFKKSPRDTYIIINETPKEENLLRRLAL